MRNKCSFLFFYGGRRKGEDEGGGLRCGWLLVEIQKKRKKRKRKDETKGPATPHYVLLTMENVLLFRVKFSSP